MTRSRTLHRCMECGAEAPRWSGRCPACSAWNTMVEEKAGPAGPGLASVSRPAVAPTQVADVDVALTRVISTGLPELDRVLGGGLIPGSVTLVGGEPGIGKSTLMLQCAAAMAGRGLSCLIVSAEESLPQVRHRAERLGALAPGVWLAAETAMPGVQKAVAEVGPDVLIVDSIQTIWDPDLESSPGSVTQVRGCAHQLVSAAKAGGPATILLGHVTKEGALAGPRVLEHLVDTVLSFEGDRHHALRMLRAMKHRFGGVGEVGLFEMTGSGLVDVSDPGRLFLSDRRSDAPGSVIFPAMEGHRPLLVEIQALVAPAPGPTPKRSASGFDSSRLSLLLAVLDRRAGLSFSGYEVFVSVAGGVKITDPGADLAVCVALASAVTERPVDAGSVFLGEVGLGGEIRHVARTPRRLAEASRLGFSRAVTAPGADAGDAVGLALTGVDSVLEALDGHLGRPSQPARLKLVR